MKPSLIPLLILVEFAAIFLAARRATKRKEMTCESARWIYRLLLLLAAWAAASASLAWSGVYSTPVFLAAYPTFWLPFVPLLLILLPALIWRPARMALHELIDATPIRWLAGIQALRVLAIGTLIKAWQGTFSMSFALYVGIPDLLYGISALAVLGLVSAGRIGLRGFAAWNIAGILVIVPGAPVVAQMSLPGALYSIVETPSAASLYGFPMVLAPTFVVPVFVTINLLVAIRFIARARAK